MFKDFLNLIYPLQCAGCSSPLVQSEKAICSGCWMELINFDLHDQSKFLYHSSIQYHYFSYHFIKNSVIQQILHQIKYNGNKTAAFVLGVELGNLIKKQHKVDEDCILVPVPASIKKRRKRGYNQTEIIAEGISSVTNYNINNQLLKRKNSSKTQTMSTVFERWQNIENEYQLNSRLSQKSNIIIVDDVVTTGSTLYHCIQSLEGQYGNLYVAAVAAV